MLHRKGLLAALKAMDKGKKPAPPMKGKKPMPAKKKRDMGALSAFDKDS